MSNDTTRLRILFLEDQVGRIELIRAEFAHAGFFPGLAFVPSSAEAIRTVMRDPVNVLFFNEALSEGNTAQFIREINGCSVGALAMIMMTADDSERNALQAIADGADESVPAGADSIRQYPRLALRAHARLAANTLRAGLPARVRDILRDNHWLSVIGSQVPGFGHEINNPLTGTIAYTDMLIQQTADEAVKQDLNKVLRSAEQCKKLLDNLLAFARQGAQAKSLESVNAVIDRAIDLRSYGLRSKNIIVIKDYNDLPAVFMDGQQLQQVFLHIVMNAEQAIAEGGAAQGRISIATRYKKETRIVQIRIADNGPGIPAAVLPRLFDPFFSTSPVRCGLGLSESRRIVAGHGGSLQAEQGPGSGAVFTIELQTGTVGDGEPCDNRVPLGS